MLVLAGPPGIGKPRLLYEAQTRALALGWTGSWPGAAGAVAQSRADLAGCAWPARLLPDVVELGAEPLPGWTLTPAQERCLVVRALERFLRNVAGLAGTLFTLDGLHWAGPNGVAEPGRRPCRRARQHYRCRDMRKAA